MTSSSLSVLFAAGGSGGHLFPAIAVAEEFSRRDAGTSIVLVTSEKKVDAEVTQASRWDHEAVPAVPPGEWRRTPVKVLVGNWRAWRQAGAILDRRRPDVVVGCGGFASLPVLLAARTRRIPIALLEQNAIPGRVTRWASGWADLVCATFEESLGRLPRSRRTVLTGNPVRKTIADLAGRSPAAVAASRTLLVLGGSQGSHALNGAMRELAGTMASAFSGWKIVHQTGERDREAVAAAYRQAGLDAEVSPFLADLPQHYAEAGLAISRAGATTLAELACAGVPSILVPYPHAADDHQRANAEVFAGTTTAGGGVMVEQTESTFTAKLATVLRELIASDERRTALSEAMRRRARPAAASDVGDAILRLVGR